MTIRGVVAGLALAGLTLTACGGSETPSGPTNPPVVVGPTVLGISPGSGPTSGGTTVTISGANFAAGAAVSIGGSAATSVAVVSSTSITAVTGASAAGAAGVTVTIDGRSSTLASAFTYVALPPPTISGISPSSGSTAGGTTVTLTGTNFASGATVTIGGVAATGVTALSSTSLRAVTGPRAAGAADVVVDGGHAERHAGERVYVRRSRAEPAAGHHLARRPEHPGECAVQLRRRGRGGRRHGDRPGRRDARQRAHLRMERRGWRVYGHRAVGALEGADGRGDADAAQGHRQGDRDRGRHIAKRVVDGDGPGARLDQGNQRRVGAVPPGLFGPDELRPSTWSATSTRGVPGAPKNWSM